MRSFLNRIIGNVFGNSQDIVVAGKATNGLRLRHADRHSSTSHAGVFAVVSSLEALSKRLLKRGSPSYAGMLAAAMPRPEPTACLQATGFGQRWRGQPTRCATLSLTRVA